VQRSKILDGRRSKGYALSRWAPFYNAWESHSDFQGRWKGWKTCFWFSRLSTDRHFTAFAGLQFGRIAIITLNCPDTL
jgi:hypothetical protein